MHSVKTDAYLDCNATTPTLPVAAEAALEAMRTLYGNPSSTHLVGLQAKHLLESARKIAAEVIGADPMRIIFTSGATEAIQTAVFSVLETAKQGGFGGADRVLYAATEHKAVPQALNHWVKSLDLPLKVVELPVDERGQVKLDRLKAELPKALMLCTMAVNNETGVIQDLARIEDVLRESKSKARWLVDCVQALGKQPLRLRGSRIDYAAFSGHKLYAPKGIGFLYASEGAPVVPLIVGGGQERGMRSGTENLPGVAAFGAVLAQLKTPGSPLFTAPEKLKRFRDRLVETLRAAFPKVEFNTPFDVSVPTTVNFSVPGFSSKELLDLFDSAGVRLSAGSACSSASVEPSHVLDAMGVPEWRSTSALRLSFGPCTTEAEIERGCKAIRQAALALQSSCLMNTVGGFDAPESLRDGVVQLRVGATNCWIVADRESRRCVVIDPSQTVAERVESYVRCQNLEVLAVLDSHSHADHESVRPVLQKVLSDQFRDVEKGFDALGWPVEGDMQVTLGDDTTAPALRFGKVDGGERVLTWVATPGHTDDSRVILLGVSRDGKLAAEDVQFAFCGDTILSGGLGRTNFVVSDPKALFHSLERLPHVMSLRTLLCPAHDYDNSFATTLEAEVVANMLLKLAIGVPASEALDLFVRQKKEIDQKLESLEKQFQGVVCGVTNAVSPAQDAEVRVSLAVLKERLTSGVTVIDVREPQEYAVYKDWKGLGLKEAPRNVPLSRFVNFMRERLGSAKGKAADGGIVLLCRSGNRSLQAAKTLRRMGFDRVWSLEGGVALLSSA